MYRINQTVIIPEDWIDESYVCKGKIVGVEKIQDGSYFGYMSFKELSARYTKFRYKVIYEHMNRASEKWYYEEELDSVNKVKK